MKYAMLLALTVLVSACGTESHYASSSQPPPPATEPLTKSLFDSKDRTISEEDIQKLLNGKVVLPPNLRVALFKYGSTSMNRYYSNWRSDEEYLKTQQNFVDTLAGQLTSSKRIKRVFPVPSLVTSSAPNITQLRETAVRLQSDVLVVFSITSDVYYKYKAFAKNEAKAIATTEAIIMDIRTGVIPYSTIITKERQIFKEANGLDNAETRKKAEQEAITESLVAAGKEMAHYLNAAE